MKHPRPVTIPGPGPGYQPVRFLQPMLLGAFENAAPGFLDLLQQQVDYGGANPAVDYEMAAEPAKGPHIEGADGTIWLQETFLSYLWGVSYATLVVYDEMLVRPRITLNYARSAEQQGLINDATALFGYALSLFDYFTPWPLAQLPNPELYSEQEAYYVKKADSVFVMAAVFILLHEYAHFYLAHLEGDVARAVDGSTQPVAERKADEFAADRFAIQTMLEGAAHVGGAMANTIRNGIVVGLSAILLPHPTLDGGDEHPDPHQRLFAGLSLLGQEPNDNLWGVGAMMLSLWAFAQRKALVGGQPYESLKDLFMVSLDQLNDPRYYTE